MRMKDLGFDDAFIERQRKLAIQDGRELLAKLKAGARKKKVKKSSPVVNKKIENKQAAKAHR